MSFLDDFGDSIINGIDRAVDSEFAEQPVIRDDRTFVTQDSTSPTVTAGNSGQDFVTKNKNMLLIGGAVLLGVVVLLKS